MNDTEPAIPPAPPPALSSVEPRRSWGRRIWEFPITRFVVYVLVFGVFAAVLFGLLRLVAVLLHHHVRSGQGGSMVGMVLGEGIAAASAVAAFWVMVRFVEKRPWASAGFSGREALPELLRGFGLGAALLSVGVGVMAATGVYRVTGSDLSLLVLAPLPLYFCVGVFEEIFFRGYLFQTLEGRWGSGAALAGTSLLFGLAHLANTVHGVTTFERLAGPVFICLEAGLPLAGAYLLTRRWWLPIGLHWAWDYFEGPIFGCPDSGTHDPHTLLHARLAGPHLVTGGPFGPESGLVLLIAGATLGVLLIRAAIRRGQWRPRKSRRNL